MGATQPACGGYILVKGSVNAAIIPHQPRQGIDVGAEHFGQLARAFNQLDNRVLATEFIQLLLAGAIASFALFKPGGG